MITEDYVSFETAKLLKEKGFSEWCYKCYGDAVYHKGIPISFDEECELKAEGLGNEIEYVEGGHLYDFGCYNRKKDAKVWAAPTLWAAMKWLRETHNIDIAIYAENLFLGKRYSASIWKDITRRDNKDGAVIVAGAITYEEAAETSIRYCLENLI